jgi:copper chaperone CopZ
MEVSLKEYTVNCEHCKAKVGKPCTREDGVILVYVVHPARERLFAIVNDPKYLKGKKIKVVKGVDN